MYFSADAYFKINNIKKPKNVVFKEQQYQVKLYKLINNTLYLLNFSNENTINFTIKPNRKEVFYTVDLSEYNLSYNDNIWLQLKPLNQCKECLVMIPVVKYTRKIKGKNNHYTTTYFKYDIEMQLE